MYKNRIDNIGKMSAISSGKYDIPIILPDDVDQIEWIGFNYVKSQNDCKGKGVHFFLDDYQFLRTWNNPNDYIDKLRKFDCVLSPDFSTFTDYPMAMQIFNHYRKHWIGAYWQNAGIPVIPTISWSDEKSFEWCFDGEPKESVIAVSSIGTQKNPKSKDAFLFGYNKMMEELRPKKILFYGNVPKECHGNIVNIEAFQNHFRKDT